jgi:hypothetical protein
VSTENAGLHGIRAGCGTGKYPLSRADPPKARVEIIGAATAAR